MKQPFQRAALSDTGNSTDACTQSVAFYGSVAREMNDSDRVVFEEKGYLFLAPLIVLSRMGSPSQDETRGHLKTMKGTPSDGTF